jgi:hypothetical protein
VDSLPDVQYFSLLGTPSTQFMTAFIIIIIKKKKKKKQGDTKTDNLIIHP